MRNFLVLVGVMICFALVALFSAAPLSAMIEPSSEMARGYSATDLGFVLEEKNPSGAVVYERGGEIVGECIMLSAKRFSLAKIADKLGLFVTRRYNVQGALVVEGVSNKLKYTLSGRQANVQIAARGDTITIGNPIIYGSY